MSIAPTVIGCLQALRTPYEVIAHSHSGSSRESAREARVPADQIAKAVVLGDGGRYFMAVIPGSCHLDLEALRRLTGRPLALIPEAQLVSLFRDCEAGAVPPLGPAYGMETAVDDAFVGQTNVYFEAGDHEELIRVTGEQFLQLLRDARHGHFSH